MQYTIGEFSQLTDISIHTLRYYEKEGLIIPKRTSSNRRVYSKGDIAWIDFIKRLKATGMPIKEIRKYAALRALGDPSLSERMEMLIKHRETLKAQLLLLEEHMSKLDDKIAWYQKEIERARKRGKYR